MSDLGQSDATEPQWPKLRSEGEQDAYMAGQRAALKLVRENNLEYAEGIIRASQRTILEVRERNP